MQATLTNQHVTPVSTKFVRVINSPELVAGEEFCCKVDTALTEIFAASGTEFKAALERTGFQLIVAPLASVALRELAPERQASAHDDAFGILFNIASGLVIVPERAVGKMANVWHGTIAEPRALQAAIAHDISHAFDQRVGKLLFGSPLSAQSEFRAMLLEESRTAESAGRLDLDRQVNPYGGCLFHYLPIASKIPDPFADWGPRPAENPIRYAEGFAEMSACHLGMSVVPTKLFEEICPRSFGFVGAQVASAAHAAIKSTRA